MCRVASCLIDDGLRFMAERSGLCGLKSEGCRLLWITLDKQVCAKIVLVQTDHSKYYQRCLGPGLGSVCFEDKQWPHTHNLSLLEDMSAVFFYFYFL